MTRADCLPDRTHGGRTVAAMTSVWSEHFTKEGRVYYYNRSTKQSSWEKPANFDGESAADAKAGATTASSTSTSSSSFSTVTAAATAGGDAKKQTKDAIEWEELWDPKNERPYYYNRATRKTQWLRPENVEIKPYGGAAANAAGTTSSSASTKKSEAKVKKADKSSEDASATTTSSAAKSEAAGAKSSTKSGGTAAAAAKAIKHHEQDEDEGATSSSQRVDDDTASAEDAGNKNDAQTAVDAEKQASQDDSLAQSKKRKKSKVKKERSDSIAGTTADNNISNGSSSHWRKKKQQRVAKDGETRMIICDDDDQMQSRPIQEKDTEDGKEATRLLQQLSQPDAIMEMNVLNVINGFLRAHNESNGPEILVEALSSSYRGHAQMVSLVASWLDTLPVSKTALEKKVTYDVAEGAVHESKDGASWDPAEEILYQHLKDVVTQHYEPKLVRYVCIWRALMWGTKRDTNFLCVYLNQVSNVLSGSSAEPEWLTQMLGARKWRLMLIELAETHKVQALLKSSARVALYICVIMTDTMRVVFCVC